jgi:hypothetical protein
MYPEPSLNLSTNNADAAVGYEPLLVGGSNIARVFYAFRCCYLQKQNNAPSGKRVRLSIP